MIDLQTKLIPQMCEKPKTLHSKFPW